MNPSPKTRAKPTVSKVFVVDDDAAVREALSSLVRSIDLKVETLSSVEEFLRRKKPRGPACLVLDIRMPGMSGLDLQRELVALDRQIPIIFITGHGDIPMAVTAMKNGAVEFLSKPFKEQDLLKAVSHAIERDCKRLKRRVASAGLPPSAPVRKSNYKLTRREKEILLLMVKGFLKKEIADHFSLSFHTVNNHERRLYHKLKVHTRSAAVAKALMEGLLP